MAGHGKKYVCVFNETRNKSNNASKVYVCKHLNPNFNFNRLSKIFLGMTIHSNFLTSPMTRRRLSCLHEHRHIPDFLMHLFAI